MTAEELKDTIYYNGQIRAMRQVCIDRKLVPIEQLALMETREVCEVITKHFEVLGFRDSGSTVMIVEKDKWDEVMEYITLLYR